MGCRTLCTVTHKKNENRGQFVLFQKVIKYTWRTVCTISGKICYYKTQVVNMYIHNNNNSYGNKFVNSCYVFLKHLLSIISHKS